MTFKVGDKVKSEMHNDTGVIQEIYNDVPDNQYGYDILFTCGNEWHVHAPADLTPYIVPIGYTGKLKDMDLQEGDVVRYVSENGGEYVIDKVLSDDGWNTSDYTLISRASETWSNWHMSRKDGSYDVHPNREYETNPLPDTDQVTYRWRDVAVKEPVVTTQETNMYWDANDETFYHCMVTDHPCTITVTLHDGIPVSMSGEFTPKTATQS